MTFSTFTQNSKDQVEEDLSILAGHLDMTDDFEDRNNNENSKVYLVLH